jgi:hypothetical protein
MSLLAALRADLGWRDDPLRARWAPLPAPPTATVCAFSPRGRFLAVGTLDGESAVWEVAGGSRALVRSLRVPPEADAGAGAGAGAGARGARAVAALGWSGNARLLFSASAGGVVAVYDVAAGAAVRVLFLAPLLGGAAPRLLRPCPAHAHLFALVPAFGMPWVLDISARGGAAQLSEALLPPPRSKKARAALARRGAGSAGRVAVLSTDVAWAPLAAGAAARELVVFTSRGDVTRVRLPAEPAARAATRVAYALTPPPVVPVEIMASGAGGGGGGGVVMLTTRAGLVVLDALTLLPAGAERYAETVDNTPLVTARFGAAGAVYALPHEHSGHMAGGVYAFRRGVVGDIRLKRAPQESGGIVRFDASPSSGVLAAIGARGALYTLQEPVVSRWPGPMYPPREGTRACAQGGGRGRGRAHNPLTRAPLPPSSPPAPRRLHPHARKRRVRGARDGV